MVSHRHRPFQTNQLGTERLNEMSSLGGWMSWIYTKPGCEIDKTRLNCEYIIHWYIVITTTICDGRGSGSGSGYGKARDSVNRPPPPLPQYPPAFLQLHSSPIAINQQATTKRSTSRYTCLYAMANTQNNTYIEWESTRSGQPCIHGLGFAHNNLKF